MSELIPEASARAIEELTRLRAELAATKARLDIARKALEDICCSAVMTGREPLVFDIARTALAALEVPAADTTKGSQ